jgi:hypothetical protein
MNATPRKGLYNIVTSAIGLVLLCAALAKIAQYEDFTGYLRQIRIFPVWLDLILAVTIPSLELSFGCVLLLRQTTKRHDVTLCALFSVFLAYQTCAAIPDLQLAPESCPCFGYLDVGASPAWLIARNGILLTLALARLTLKQREPERERMLNA